MNNINKYDLQNWGATLESSQDFEAWSKGKTDFVKTPKIKLDDNFTPKVDSLKVAENNKNTVNLDKINSVEDFVAFINSQNNQLAEKSGAPVIGDIKTAPILIIADMPSKDDDLNNKYLSDHRGVLFDKIIKALGWKNADFSIVPCSFWRTIGERLLTPNEQTILQPIYKKLVDIIKPKYIMLWGSASLFTMTASFGNRNSSGFIDSNTFLTFSLQAVQNNTTYKKLFWNHLQEFNSTFKSK
ncbi:MAG: hypothetical protein JJV93_01465 [Alphaproteobacteria bacterium]|nr:hypothetical protein [Alphaproteobacteria bacterium]